MSSTEKLVSKLDQLHKSYTVRYLAIAQSDKVQSGIPLSLRAVVDSTPVVFSQKKNIDGALKQVDACRVRLSTFQAPLYKAHADKSFKKQPSLTIVFQNKAVESAKALTVGSVIDVICTITDKYSTKSNSYYTEIVSGTPPSIVFVLKGYVEYSIRAAELKKAYSDSVNRPSFESKIEIDPSDYDFTEEEILF